MTFLFICSVYNIVKSKLYSFVYGKKVIGSSAGMALADFSVYIHNR